MTAGIASLIKIGAITVILSKSLKAIGKKDYGDVVKLSGVAMCGICIIKMINNFNSPSKTAGYTSAIEYIIKGIGKGLQWLITSV